MPKLFIKDEAQYLQRKKSNINFYNVLNLRVVFNNHFQINSRPHYLSKLSSKKLRQILLTL